MKNLYTNRLFNRYASERYSYYDLLVIINKDIIN